MKNILIHGLGQSSKDWNTVKNELEIKTAAPDLFKLIKGRELSYIEVYQAFCQLCLWEDCWLSTMRSSIRQT